MDATATGELAPASMQLPERQREVLALREEGLSYEEIAAKLGTTRDRVAQLIAHAWINLYDEEVGTVLASIAPSPDCERALGLIAARHDGELEAGSPDGEWLEGHLTACHRCRRGVDEMGEAYALYRSSGEAAPRRRHRWLRAWPRAGVAAGVVTLLAGAGLAMALVGDDPTRTPAEPAVGATTTPRAADRAADGTSRRAKGERERRAARKRRRAAEASGQRARSAGTPVDATTSAPASTSVPVAGDGGGDSGSAPRGSRQPSGQTTVQPPRRVATSRPKPRTDPAPVSAAPASTADTGASTPPAPPPEPEAAPNGNAPSHANRPAEPPGKAAGRPSS